MYSFQRLVYLAKLILVLLTFFHILKAHEESPRYSPAFELLKQSFSLGHMRHKISEIIVIYSSSEFKEHFTDLFITISNKYDHLPAQLFNQKNAFNSPSSAKYKTTRYRKLDHFPLVIFERDGKDKASRIIDTLKFVFRPATINVAKYIIIRRSTEIAKNKTGESLPESHLKPDSLKTIRDKMEIWTSKTKAGVEVATMRAYCTFCSPITTSGKLKNGNLLVAAFDNVRGYVEYAPTFPDFSKSFHGVSLTYIFVIMRKQDGTDKGWRFRTDLTERQAIEKGNFINLMFKTVANGIHWNVGVDDFIYIKAPLTADKFLQNGSLNLPKPPNLPWNAVVGALPLFIISDDMDQSEVYNRNEITVVVTKVPKESNTDETYQLIFLPLVLLVPVVLLLRKLLLSIHQEYFWNSQALT